MDSGLPITGQVNALERKKKNKKRSHRIFKSKKNSDSLQTREGIVSNLSNFKSTVDETNSTKNVNKVSNEIKDDLAKNVLEQNKRKRRRRQKKKQTLNEKEQNIEGEDHGPDKKIKCLDKKDDELLKSDLKKSKNSKWKSDSKSNDNRTNVNKLKNKKKNFTREINNKDKATKINGKAKTFLTNENERKLGETEVSLEIVKNVMNINNFFSVTKNVIPDLNWKHTCPICCERLEFFGMLPCNHCICMLCLLKQSILVEESSCFLCRKPFKSLIFFKVDTELPTVYPPININDCKRRYLSRNNTNFQRRNDIVFGCSLTVLAFDTFLQHYCWVCHVNNTPCTFKTFHELERHYVIQHKRSFCSICVEYEQKLSIERIPFTSKELSLHLSGRLTPYNNLVTNDHAKCSFCPIKTFYNSENLFRHYRLQHQTCELCFNENNEFLVFDIFEDLLQHYENNHFPCSVKNCKINGICFSSELELQLHMSEVHPTTKKRQALPLKNATYENDRKRKTIKNYQQNGNGNSTLNVIYANERLNNFQMDQSAFPSLLSNPLVSTTNLSNDGPSFASIVAKQPIKIEEPSVTNEEVENIITSITINNFENGERSNSSSVNRSNSYTEGRSNILTTSNKMKTKSTLPNGCGDIVGNKNDMIIEINNERGIGDEGNSLLNKNDCNHVVRRNVFWRMINFILFPLTAFQRAITNLISLFSDFFINRNLR
uniref:RING-type domain-containing protein n=1 Tax=Strongyloides stercoralis TaxID=6248 RepID=A0A0K0EE56_STRER